MKLVSRLLLPLLLLSALSVEGQKYKVKKDVIYLDKEEVGRVAGDDGLAPDFTILGRNNEKVLSVRQKSFRLSNPFLGSVYWYYVRFEDTGKELNMAHYGSCGAKCMLKNVFTPAGLIFEGGPLQNQDDFIAKKDITALLHKDTSDILFEHNQMLRLLEKNEILRDFEKPVKVYRFRGSEPGSPVMVTEYHIAQDNVIIGRVVKTHKQTSTSASIDYEIYEKLYEPEEGLEDVPACKVTSTFTDLKFQTVVDGREHAMRVQDINNAEKLLVYYLVKNGYL